MPWDAVLVLVGAYGCGAIPSGLWLGRLAGVDVRAHGSGNIGTVNVARTAGLWLAALTLVADMAKGAVPLLAARAAGAGTGMLAVAGLMAFFGHIFSIFVRFRGGKGVATAAGVFLVLSPWALVGAFAVYVVTTALRRIPSLSSLCAGTALPVFVAVLDGRGVVLTAAIVVAVSLVLTHRDNLRRLANGTEPVFRRGHPPA